MLSKILGWFSDKVFRLVVMGAAFFWAYISGFFKGKDNEKIKHLEAEKTAGERARHNEHVVTYDADERERVRREFDRP